MVKINQNLLQNFLYRDVKTKGITIVKMRVDIWTGKQAKNIRKSFGTWCMASLKIMKN